MPSFNIYFLSMAVVIYINDATFVSKSLNRKPVCNWSKHMLIILLSLRLYSKNIPHPSYLGYAWMTGPFFSFFFYNKNMYKSDGWSWTCNTKRFMMIVFFTVLIFWLKPLCKNTGKWWNFKAKVIGWEKKSHWVLFLNKIQYILRLPYIMLKFKADLIV